MFDHSSKVVTVKICYNKKRFHHESYTIIMLLISASGIRQYFHKVHIVQYVCEFRCGTLNKFQFVVYFKSAVTFFYGNGKVLLGVKGPPTNSKTIISLCNKVAMVKVNILVRYHVKKKIVETKYAKDQFHFLMVIW